ncbi:TPA: hypothetical protein U6L17_002815 [Klebsiella pneumoniae]|uniref:hypothetical protein n=1 Tax=Klebsiella pneumoniae TaxID=573 RepID=UPI002404D981|nr:hypothetical protein [Klebsiella pneumoniae]MDF9924236.1 hypothetical protein [Klebsiella pneumoniae]HEN5278097.1 hypothetical protein [Klebsiella pneumoniae]
MTTNITELAQSLKAAAIDAKELAIIARYSKGRAAAEKFYALANPNNVIALVEALEKAQQTIAFQQGEIKALLSSLESRTVTVKLPQAVSAGGQGYQEQVERILTAAGIKVEAK